MPVDAKITVLDTVIVDSLVMDSEQGGVVIYSGKVNFNLSNAKNLPLYSTLTLVPENDSSSEGIIPFHLSGNIGDLGKAAGPQSAIFRCKVGQEKSGRFRAKIQVSDSMIVPSGNIRQKQSRVFYLGNSVTQDGEFARVAEKTLQQIMEGGNFSFNTKNGQLPHSGGMFPWRQHDGVWTLPDSTEIRMVSWGWSGAKVEHLLSLPTWMQVANDFKADVVIVEMGINDAGQESYNSTQPLAGIDEKIRKYKEGLSELAERIRLMGAHPVFLSPTPANEAKSFGGRNLAGFNQPLAKIAQACREVAREKNVRFVSFFDEYLEAQKQDAGIQAYDGLHPTPAGHAFMAKLLSEALGYDKPFRRP